MQDATLAFRSCCKFRHTVHPHVVSDDCIWLQVAFSKRYCVGASYAEWFIKSDQYEDIPTSYNYHPMASAFSPSYLPILNPTTFVMTLYTQAASGDCRCIGCRYCLTQYREKGTESSNSVWWSARCAEHTNRQQANAQTSRCQDKYTVCVCCVTHVVPHLPPTDNPIDLL